MRWELFCTTYVLITDDSLSQTRLSIIQIECPEFTASDLLILEEGQRSGKPHKKRVFWPIPEQAERVFQKIKNFTPHQAYHYLLFKLAGRDGAVEPDIRLNLPNAQLDVDDYDYWCKADFWYISDFIGLMIGRQPDEMNHYFYSQHSPTSEVGSDAFSLRLLLNRSVERRVLENASSPFTLLTWAISKQIEIPEILAKTAKKYGLFDDSEEITVPNKSVSWDASNVVSIPKGKQLQNPELGLKTKERDSMMKLVIGMAVRAYTYDPNQKRSPIASEISDDLAACGISMDVDTIRKYLKQSSEYLSRDFKPNSDKQKPNSQNA